MTSQDFVNPSTDHRLIPYWIWNGTIEENELVRQIQEMKEKGIGGFCLVAGSGLRTPYLSQVWFDRVRTALETAAEYGLQVWIHDEYRYPGGIGSTHVILDHPQFVAQQLTFREIVVQGGQQVDLALPWAPVLQAIAVPLRRDRCLWENTQDISAYLGANHQHHLLIENSELPIYHPHHYASLDPIRRLYWKAPAGRWRVLVFLQEPSHTTSLPGVHLDRFNPDAIRNLYRMTLQPYVEHFGDYQGKTLVGVLTAQSSSANDRLPWSSGLPDFFNTRNGYDLLACLPALITNFGPNTARIRYDYFQTLGELHQRHDNARCAEWCADHALQYACNIVPMRNAMRNAIPIPGARGGREKVGVERVKDYQRPTVSYQHNTSFAAALAAQTGAQRIFNACFQNTGWALTLQDMKTQLDALGIQGTNFFFLHGFYYTLDGLRKHSAPPSLFHQNPYWKHFGLLADYAGRLAYALRRGQTVADIALIDPVTSLWSHLSHPYHNWSYMGYDADEASLVAHLVADWSYITDALHEMQRPFHTLDPQILAQAKVVGNQLRVGNMHYSVLVIPPITNFEREAFDMLREFINAGGQVISLGLLPIEDIQEGTSVVEGFSRLTDMEPGRMIRDYTGHELGVHLLRRNNFCLIRTGGTIAQNQAGYMLARLLDEVLPRRIHVLSDGQNADAIRYHHRIDGDKHLFFFINTGTKALQAQLHLPIPKGDVEHWDLETGACVPLESERSGDRCTVHLAFERLQSHLLVASNHSAEVTEKTSVESLDIDAKGTWKIDAEEDNALRLDTFKMQVDPANRGVRQGWHRPTYVDSKWPDTGPGPFTQERGTEKTVCWYRATFVADVIPSKLALVMDRGAVQGDYQVYVNGSRLPSNAFRPTFRYDHTNVTCAVGRRVNKGKNTIVIRVEIASPGDGLLDAIYLFGRFQVKSWRNLYPRLAPPQDRGPVFDIEAAGLPFYAGTVAYSRDISFKSLPATETFELNLERMHKNLTDVVEVLINGHSLGVRAWTPYVLTGKTSWLKRGKNRVVFRVTNTLDRLLTGMTFQPRTHKMVPVKI